MSHFSEMFRMTSFLSFDMTRPSNICCKRSIVSPSSTRAGSSWVGGDCSAYRRMFLPLPLLFEGHPGTAATKASEKAAATTWSLRLCERSTDGYLSQETWLVRAQTLKAGGLEPWLTVNRENRFAQLLTSRSLQDDGLFTLYASRYICAHSEGKADPYR